VSCDAGQARCLRVAWRIRNAVLLLSACVMAASCGGRPVTKDFSVLSTATRIEVHDVGVRPLAVVTDVCDEVVLPQ